MAKTIAVSDEVYEMLQRAKLPGESFSEVIKRSLKRGSKLMDIFGSHTISKEDWEEVKRILHKAQIRTVKELRDR
ncbi:MAG: antitoxin VapB family protein [archaeon]|nr:antitoxin VapB family protein [archaeon]MCP8316504.1 antitoxin VapB family protein [archaeon]MCP8319466.1 antitoxin VapB family protein [archaeon]